MVSRQWSHHRSRDFTRFAEIEGENSAKALFLFIRLSYPGSPLNRSANGLFIQRNRSHLIFQGLDHDDWASSALRVLFRSKDAMAFNGFVKILLITTDFQGSNRIPTVIVPADFAIDSMNIQPSLIDSVYQQAHDLAETLSELHLQIVFAESCTAGLLSATLAHVTGISNWLCGSLVTYQDVVKTGWLKIDAELIERFSSASQRVTTAMASAALIQTPTAHISVAVTGHLEVDAVEQGSVIWATLGYRTDGQFIAHNSGPMNVVGDTRPVRQWEAVKMVLQFTLKCLRSQHVQHDIKPTVG